MAFLQVFERFFAVKLAANIQRRFRGFRLAENVGILDLASRVYLVCFFSSLINHPIIFTQQFLRLLNVSFFVWQEK